VALFGILEMYSALITIVVQTIRESRRRPHRKRSSDPLTA
jgi:hypothetical protein